MIQAHQLTKSFGPVWALRGVSFAVSRGEVAGFLGPNGAGKTTTMRILTGFFPPTSGTAQVAGYDVVDQSMEVRRRIGYFLERTPLYPEMRVEEFLHFAAEVKGVPRGRRRGRVQEVMERCGLVEVRRKIIAQLSKGYRQRVGLAQALVNDPEVLVLDEPTIGLDPEQVVEVRQFIRGLGGERTVLLSTHILSEVSVTCNKVIIIDRGRVLAVDTPENLTAALQRSTLLRVRLDGPPAEVEEALRRMSGVRRVAEEDGAFLVEAPREVDLAREVFQLAVQRGWVVRELAPRGLTLEEAFLKLVAEGE